jgi:pimeloyl-ACP methyl ester carboxylesterase
VPDFARELQHEVEALASAVKRAGVAITPNIVLFRDIGWMTNDSIHELMRAPELTYAAPGQRLNWSSLLNNYRNSWGDNLPVIPEYFRQATRLEEAITRASYKAGVPLMTGSDSEFLGAQPGFATHTEMEFFAALGALLARREAVGDFLFGVYYKERPDERLALAFYDPTLLNEKLAEDVERSLERPGTVAAALAATRGQQFAQVEKRYRTIDKPVLLLWGREDVVTTLDFGERLSKELERIEGMLRGTEAKLSNDQFVGKAPEAIILREREKAESLREQVMALRDKLEALV